MEATNDTMALIKAAQAGVARTWREVPGERPWRYNKAGVVNHRPETFNVRTAGADRSARSRSQRTADGGHRRLQRPLGRGSVVPACAGLSEKRTRSTKFEMRTLRYTTQVSELPIAHA